MRSSRKSRLPALIESLRRKKRVGKRQAKDRSLTPLGLELLEERALLANWSGNITQDTVWSSTEVQRVTGDLRVQAPAKLTIEPGTIIKLNAGVELDIFGSIDAQGTAATPIILTSYRDDSVGWRFERGWSKFGNRR